MAEPAITESSRPKIKTIAEQIVDHIQRAIFDGEIKPGEQLKEKAVSEWLGVSRTPIREALRMLEFRGLVEINSNKSVRVTRISPKDLADLFEVRLVLELHCLRKLMAQITPDQVEELEAIVSRMEESLGKNNVLAYFDLTFEFHNYLVSKSDNQRLISIFAILRNGLRCAQLHYLKDPGKLAGSVREDREIVAAIAAGDSRNAEERLREHIQSSYRRMSNSFLPKADPTG